ncbi:HNH endonuclease [candidate division WWE3 bacterium]|uniref:HNH endonuclease n=1 Tax=candidate division WWE3 bacterium TaxID=2053526 RepID=A0A7X9HSD2_UNCKA|nr:HNH endonuclease [candidate division WWE3 bacterium]
MIRSYTNEEINSVWAKGIVVVGYDTNYVRKDCYGALMERKNYGNRNSKFGWEIDHLVPVSAGGLDTISNLQPLQWENNASKGDKTLLSTLFRRS